MRFRFTNTGTVMEISQLLFRNSYLSRVFTNIKGADGTGKDNTSMILAIKKAIGENLEREVLFSKSNKNRKNPILTCNKGKFSSKMEDSFSLLLDNVAMDNFRDSSGVASGDTTLVALNNAIFEFIERQSLVYSFLSKTPGISLKKLVVKSGYVDILSKGKYFINDISIFEGISVILLIYWTEDGFTLGLGAHYNQKLAVDKAIIEALGYNAVVFKGNEKSITFEEYISLILNENKTENLYEDYFRQNMTLNKLLESYCFLSKGKEVEIWRKQTFFGPEVLKKMSSYLNISIDVQLLGTNNFNNYKVVRVSSKDAYPSINTISFDPYKFRISYFQGDEVTFYNQFCYLPFP